MTSKNICLYNETVSLQRKYYLSSSLRIFNVINLILFHTNLIWKRIQMQSMENTIYQYVPEAAPDPETCG